MLKSSILISILQRQEPVQRSSDQCTVSWLKGSRWQGELRTVAPGPLLGPALCCSGPECIIAFLLLPSHLHKHTQQRHKQLFWWLASPSASPRTFPLNVPESPTPGPSQLRPGRVVIAPSSERTRGRTRFSPFPHQSLSDLKPDRLNKPNLSLGCPVLPSHRHWDPIGWTTVWFQLALRSCAWPDAGGCSRNSEGCASRISHLVNRCMKSGPRLPLPGTPVVKVT